MGLLISECHDVFASSSEKIWDAGGAIYVYYDPSDFSGVFNVSVEAWVLSDVDWVVRVVFLVEICGCDLE